MIPNPLTFDPSLGFTASLEPRRLNPRNPRHGLAQFDAALCFFAGMGRFRSCLDSSTATRQLFKRPR